MSKIPYVKTPFSYQDQLIQLKPRGLKVANDNIALHLLEHIRLYIS